MAAFTIENLNFIYPGKSQPALSDVNLKVQTGEFLVLCGRSGSGKSTLLRSLKTCLAPHGQREGRILFYGRPLEEVSQREQARRIGYVLQNPDNQLVTDKVWHELAFGLESLGCDTKTIRLRTAEMASFFGIQGWFMRDVNQLSGGQKQLLNLAGVMAMQPDVLILDEPTSQLDPIAAGDFLETVRKINRELGTTVILSEHRLEDVIPMADRLITVDEGRILTDDAPARAGMELARREHRMFDAMPAPLQAYTKLRQRNVSAGSSCPMSVREGRGWLTELFSGKQLKNTRIPLEQEAEHAGERPVLQMKEVWFRYSKEDDDVIKGLSMEVYEGECFCLAGGNGTGKTTALSLACGMVKPYRGKILIAGKRLSDYKNKELFRGRLGVLPQSPQSIFTEKTVRLDLLEMLEEKAMDREQKEKKLQEVVNAVQLSELLEMHPYDLSGGEQQRAALAKILLLDPQILLLDEPTKGLDSYFKKDLARLLRKLQAQGKTIIMVSHDIEFCARCADRCAMFFNGSIVTTDTPRSFFSGNSFYTTAANRMSRHIFENAITAEDIVSLCAENLEQNAAQEKVPPRDADETHQENPPPASRPESQLPSSSGSAEETAFCAISPAEGAVEAAENPDQPEQGGAKQEGVPLPKARKDGPEESRVRPGPWARYKNSLCMGLMLLLAAGTIWAGHSFLEDRKYYIISLLLILYTMIPFLVRFEGKKPPARELVLISVMIAIAVAGRAAFFMLPQFKPVLALVIIPAIAMGRDTGFLIGSMTAFVSNFIFGQGPWTPWQMLAMGLIGFLAGLLAEKKLLGNKKLPLLIFGGCCALLYGLIVDIWTILSMTPEPSLITAAVVYASSLPFNLVLGAATVFFLYFLGKPMLEKLDRMKLKYGVGA